ncbi:MAG: hypothetical protein HDS33_07200 [Bacteroides sp.]|nr:hypothetical protein [Bacteroides sp.]
MRKTILIIVAVIISAMQFSTYAQVTQKQLKERQELAKASKKELNEKVSKAARKEAKRLEKEKWQAAPGALPIEKQLDRSYMLQMQYDEDGFPMYVMGEGMSIGGNYDAAKMQALELAKQNLAATIQSEVVSLVKNNVVNKQLDEGKAASLAKIVNASRSRMSQSLERVITVVEMYQVVNGNNRQVLVRLAYSQEMAKATAKKAMIEAMEAEGDELQSEIDQLWGEE